MDAAPRDPHTDVAARRGQAGDREACGEAFARVAPALYAWADLRLHTSLRAHLDPEDLLQEVACRAYEGFASWDPEQAGYRPWVFGIARNVLREALRRLASQPPAQGTALASRDWADDVPDDATTISRAVARDDSLRHFVERLRRLEPLEQQLVLHCGLEGRSRADVARLLDLPAETLGKRWQRLRARLRDEPRWQALFVA